MQNIHQITLGADPELFIKNDTEIVSARFDKGGTKSSPKQISQQGHAIQEDGIMFEYNIPPAVLTNGYQITILYRSFKSVS
jgi:hypothetical protein